MKVKLLLLIFLSIISISFSQRNDQAPDFEYEIESEISTASHFAVHIQPLQMGIISDFLQLGLGGSVVVSELMDKFNLIGDFGYNYVNYSLNKNKRDFGLSNESFNKSKSLSLMAGYTFYKSEKTKEFLVHLKTAGNVEYVSRMPAYEITTCAAYVGFQSKGIFTNMETQITKQVYDPDFMQFFSSTDYFQGRFLQNTNNLVIGVMLKKASNTKYNTTKYGTVYQSDQNEFFGGILLNMGTNFSDLYNYLYADVYDPQSFVVSSAFSQTDWNNFYNGLKKLPIGLNVGYSLGGNRTNSIQYKIDLTLNPGYYSTLLDLVQLRLGIGYRFSTRI